MMTPDQIRLRLASINPHESDHASNRIVELLTDVLPDLVALARSRFRTYSGATTITATATWQPLSALMPCERCGAHRWGWHASGLLRCRECAFEADPSSLRYPEPRDDG